MDSLDGNNGLADRARGRRQADLFILTLAGAVIIAASVLSPGAQAVQLGGWTLPPLCMSRWLLSMECLGCGLTRSFVWMGHGEWASAFEQHRLGPLLYLALACQIPWRLRRLWIARGVGAGGVGD